MKICIATEQKFYRFESKYYTDTTGHYSFWKRYQAAFESVVVIARVIEVNELKPNFQKATGPGVQILPLPWDTGVITIVRNLAKYFGLIRAEIEQDSAFLLRLPGVIGTIVWLSLRLRRKGYAVEVVGDPFDSLSFRALGKWYMEIFRWVFTVLLKIQCRQATAASYVTEQTLQRRYPTTAQVQSHYSSIELTEDLIRDAELYRKEFIDQRDKDVIPELIFVGSLSQRYKGLHDLIDATKICKEQGIVFNVHVLGDGAERLNYETQVANLGLTDNFQFHGFVKQGKEVIKLLCRSDLFVMPSLVEGLPRAMIEAMVCGLPCLGSNIGGIPELIKPEYLFDPGKPDGLANKIMEILNDPLLMQAAAVRNSEHAKINYGAKNLVQRRDAYYGNIRQAFAPLEKHSISVTPN